MLSIAGPHQGCAFVESTVEGKPSEVPSGMGYVPTIVNIKKGAWRKQRQLVQEQKMPEKVRAEESAQGTGITF